MSSLPLLPPDDIATFLPLLLSWRHCIYYDVTTSSILMASLYLLWHHYLSYSADVTIFTMMSLPLLPRWIHTIFTMTLLPSLPPPPPLPPPSPPLPSPSPYPERGRVGGPAVVPVQYLFCRWKKGLPSTHVYTCVLVYLFTPSLTPGIDTLANPGYWYPR